MSRPPAKPLTRRVLRLLLRSPLRGPLPRDAAARALCVSSSTLGRRLPRDGTSYQQLVDRVQLYRCRKLMEADAARGRRPSAKEIAPQLGYSGHAAFRRAFERWTGMGFGVYCDQLPLAVPRETTGAVVRWLLRQDPTVNVCQRWRVAGALDISEYTLGKRLRNEGTCYAALYQRVYRHCAERRLRRLGYPVLNRSLAQRFGYGRAEAFNDMFRRRWGITYRAWRHEQVWPT